VKNIADAEALMALPADDPGVLADFATTIEVINFYDLLSSPGRFENDEIFFAGQNAFATHVTGAINVLEGGDITFGFHANDGGRLLINGQLVAIDEFPDLASDTLGTINLPAGVHAVDFLYYQDGGGASVELYVATTVGAFTSLADGSFELLLATDLPVPEGIPGDYNNDRVVDAADYIVWRNNLDTLAVLPNDSTPGVTIEDYQVWKQSFGMTVGGGAVTMATTVPEPATFALCGIAGMLGRCTLRRRKFIGL
jgi:hypothetical protein